MRGWPEPAPDFCRAFGAEVSLFEGRYGRVGAGPELARLFDLAARFAAIPYENLSKILAFAEAGFRPSPRSPERVMADHLALGTGGTCYSLAELFRCLAEAAGLDARPVLCTTRRGVADHCALVVGAGGARYLVDPGYLLAAPVRLPDVAAGSPAGGDRRGAPHLAPAAGGGGGLDLFTLEEEGPRWRYRFSPSPVEPEAFRALWLESFGGLDRRKIVATKRLEDGGVLYLHGHKLRTSGAGGHETRNVRDSLAHAALEGFGISPEVTRRVFAILEAPAGRRGDRAPPPHRAWAR
jgi:arylamine N-acetyltransferase